MEKEMQQDGMRSEKYEQQSPEIKVGKVVKVVPVKGDVCLIKLETKEARFCQVQMVKVPEDGLVRSVTTVYKVKLEVLPYVPVPLTEMEVAVQKLVLLVPGEKVAAGEEEEAWAEG